MSNFEPFVVPLVLPMLFAKAHNGVSFRFVDIAGAQTLGTSQLEQEVDRKIRSMLIKDDVIEQIEGAADIRLDTEPGQVSRISRNALQEGLNACQDLPNFEEIQQRLRNMAGYFPNRSDPPVPKTEHNSDLDQTLTNDDKHPDNNDDDGSSF